MPFKFNPFTDKLDLTDNNIGPFPDIDLLTPNEGPTSPVGPVANNVNMFGPTANGVTGLWPLTTYGLSPGNFEIENRVWLSPAVVDPSTTVGTRGTYSTIQSAITNYATVVGTGSNIATIYIRPGTYAENPVIPDNVNIRFVGISPANQSVAATGYGVISSGTWTQGASPLSIFFENINFTHATAFNINVTFGQLQFYNCGFNTLTVSAAPAVTYSASFFNCVGGLLTCSSPGVVEIQGWNAVGITNSGIVYARDSYLTASGAGSIIMDNCDINSGTSCTGDVIANNCYSSSSNSTANFFGGSESSIGAFNTAGTIYLRTTITGNHIVLPQEQYIAATTRVTAPTITLPNLGIGVAVSQKNQYYVFKDESGQNGTYPMTLTPNTGTIDGAASLVMNTPYQCVVLVNDERSSWSVLYSSTPISTAGWVTVTSATQTLAPNTNYITNRGAGVTYTLPSTAVVGDSIKIVGKLGLTTIAQNANQQILFGSASSTVGVGGSAAGTNVGDCTTLRVITGGTSTVWRAESYVGNWTIT